MGTPSFFQCFRLFFTDLRLGLREHLVWRTYATQDIKNRYRRSVIGPLWITLSMGITIVAIGPLYALLFGIPLQGYFPYIGAGIVFWAFLSSCIIDACTAFAHNEALIRQTRLPLSTFLFRSLFRNILILAHNLILVVLISALFRSLDLKVFYFLFTLPTIAVFLFFLSALIALFCARYRDIVQIVVSATQLFMFVTPVYWVMQQNVRSRYITYNPFYYLMNLLRNPWIGRTVSLQDWLVVCSFILCTAILAAWTLGRYRSRVAYWL